MCATASTAAVAAAGMHALAGQTPDSAVESVSMFFCKNNSAGPLLLCKWHCCHVGLLLLCRWELLCGGLLLCSCATQLCKNPVSWSCTVLSAEHGGGGGAAAAPPPQLLPAAVCCSSAPLTSSGELRLLLD